MHSFLRAFAVAIWSVAVWDRVCVFWRIWVVLFDGGQYGVQREPHCKIDVLKRMRNRFQHEKPPLFIIEWSERQLTAIAWHIVVKQIIINCFTNASEKSSFYIISIVHVIYVSLQ